MNNDQLRVQLLANLRDKGQLGQLTITGTSFESASIRALLNTYYSGNNLIIQNAVLLPDETEITVQGTAAFLNVEKAPVTATFLAAADDVDLILRYQLPATWTFSQSFPNLPISWDFRTPFSATQSSLLDTLTLTDAHFVVSTVAHIDPQFQVQLAQELNFISHLHLNGIAGGLETLLHIPQPLILAGPILLPQAISPVNAPQWPQGRDSQPLPGINLKAEANVALSIGQLELAAVFLRLYSPPSLDWLSAHPQFEPSMFFGGDLHIGRDVTLEVVAQKVPGMDNLLIFSGIFPEAFHLPALSQLIDLVGSDDLLQSLNPLTSFSDTFLQNRALSIEALSLSITTDPLLLETVTLLVSLGDGQWKTIDGLIEVDNLAVRFQVDHPLDAQRSLEVLFIGDMTIDTVPLTISASAPEFLLRASLDQDQTLPLSTLLHTYLPDVPPVSDLTIDQLYLEAQPGRALCMLTTLADQPQPWQIDLGITTLTASNLQLLLSYVSGSGVSGILGGTLSLAGVDLTMVYQIPGPLMLLGQLPTISLRTLLTSLCGSTDIWPASFDIELTNSRIRIEKLADAYMLVLGTQINDLGSLALQVSRDNSAWAFAVGVDVQAQWKLSSLSSALTPFDNSFTFQKLVLVLSTIQSPAFSFPDLASFNDPTIASTRITLPASANGISKGCNIFAKMTFGGSSKGIDFVKQILHLDQATLDVLLQISANPTNAMLSATISGQFNEAITFTGALRAMLRSDELLLGLLGQVSVTVQHRPLIFTGEIEITDNGAFFAATLQGSWDDAFTLPGLTLSDLALELGIDLELVPTIGLAGTLTYKEIQGTSAIVFDSMTPSKSLIAGSISDIVLTSVYHTFIAAPLPTELDTALDHMALKGIPLFTLPLTLTTDLDTGILTDAIAQAFVEQGKTTLGTSKQILLVVGQAGSLWYLSDRSTLKHYTITRQQDQLHVSLAVQMAIVPDATLIGQLTYPQGIRLTADLEFLGLNASTHVEIDQQNGIVMDATMSSLDLGELFRLTGHSGQGDPLISLATYDAPSSLYRGPHCVVSGALTILECTRDLDVKITRNGVTFSMAGSIFNVFQASISAQCPLTDFAIANYSLTATMDNDLFQFLKTRGTAAIEQAAASARTQITQAQNNVNSYQQQVNTLNGQIATQTAIIQGERTRAQQALQNAQANVNSIQSTINANQSAIDELNREIADLESDTRSHPWLFAKNGALITEKGIEIGGHETAIGSEQGALATATAVLNSSRSTVVTTPIAADPRVASLYVALQGATLSLQGATSILQGIKQASGRLANVVDWVAQHGENNLLIVTHASFAGQLSQVSGGQVAMALDFTLMGQPYHLNQAFNFHDVEQVATLFAEQLKQLI
jgi:hypothetical protein